MCDKFWCIWSQSYNEGDPAFTHDENCAECNKKFMYGCELCGHLNEDKECEYDKVQTEDNP